MDAPDLPGTGRGGRMRLSFLNLPADERRLYIEQAAVRRNVSAVVLEKDFWVCWLLGLLFGSEFAGSLIFKGGTSLSKVYGVIERFSEDIDLSLSREDFGFVGERDPYLAPSGKKKAALVDEIVTECRRAIATELLPRLHSRFENVIGPEDS